MEIGGLIMGKTILVETSARHVHLSQADLETLFGKRVYINKTKKIYLNQDNLHVLKKLLL